MSGPVSAPLSPERIASGSKSSFLVSFAVLERPRREALTSIYAFCRVVDDVADRGGDPVAAAEELQFWAAELSRAENGQPVTEVGRALRHAMQEYGVDRRHLDNVLAGMRQDLDGPQIETFADLEQYCYRVASSVGLACLPVFGASGAAAEIYAARLGQALQITNILRDLRVDAEIGRVYVPTELLTACGVEVDWLLGRGPDEVYRDDGPVARMVRPLITLAHVHFGATDNCDPALRKKLLPAEIMGAVYRELLARVEERGADVCRPPLVRLSRWRKLWIAWRARRRVMRG